MTDRPLSSEQQADGEPRYRVSRLTQRRILARYGVMCGTGTRPVFETYSFYRALLIRSLLQGAFEDGVFVSTKR